MSPTELFRHLQENFWTPLKRKGIAVGCYVIKTRWNWRDVQQFLPEVNEDYIARYCVRAKQFRAKLQQPGEYGERKGIFFYMVLVHREYETIDFHNGQAYWDIVRNGQDVWIKRDSQTAVIRPAYSHMTKPLVYTTQHPKDEGAYMKVAAVKQAKKGPYIKDHGAHRRATYKPFNPEQYEET